MQGSPNKVRIDVSHLVLICVVSVLALTGRSTFGNSDSPAPEEPGIRATVAALSIARHVRSLTDSSSFRTHADMSAEMMAESKASIEFHADAIRQQLEVLANTDHIVAAMRMDELLSELVISANQLDEGRSLLAESLRDSRNSRQKIIAETNWELLPAALTSEDDMFHRLISDSGVSQTKESITSEGLLLYNRLALLKQQIDQGYIVLEVATRQTDSEFIATMEENVNLVMYQLRENIAAFSNSDLDKLDPSLVPLAGNLLDAAYGESNLIDLMKSRLRLSEQETQLADAIDIVASSLQQDVYAVLEDTIGEIERKDSLSETAKALKAVLTISQHADAVLARSTDDTSVNTPLSKVPEVREIVRSHVSGIRQGLGELVDLGYDSDIAHLHTEVDRVGLIAERILDGRPALSSALKSAAQERARLRSFVDHQLDPAVLSSMDNQLYYMLTGRSEFREEGAIDSDRLSQTEFLRYWHLALVNDSIFRTFSGLIIAIIMTDATLIGEGEERFITASHRLEKSIDFLEEQGGAEVDAQLVPLARQFIAFGNGESNVFDSLRQRLPLIATERQLIQANQRIFATLQVDIDALLDSILENATSSG